MHQLMVMEAASTAQGPQASTSSDDIATHRSDVLEFVVSETKLRSLVAWARLESSRHRGGDQPMDSLLMKLRCEDGDGISGARGALDGRAGIGASRGVLRMVSSAYFCARV